MKKVDLDNEQFSEEMKVQIETIKAHGDLLKNLEVNQQVMDANIHELFIFYNQAFFNGKLDAVLLEWSERMTLCAGICYYSDGFCTVRLSKSLLKFRKLNELLETLIHEMIHAYLFLTKKSYTRDGSDGHGKDFQDKMKEINQVTGLGITVYHSFHDEVESCRQHVWLCNGKCRKRPPYYGIVKRSRNMPPSERDDWYPQHQIVCGGSFVKIAEPENYKMKEKQTKKEKQINTLDKYLKSDEKEPYKGEEEKEEKKELIKKRKRKDANIDEEQPQETKGKKLKKNKDLEIEQEEKLKHEELMATFDDDELDLALQEALLKIMNVKLFDIPQVDENVVQTINEKLKFDKVTKVQKAVIPLFLSNKDVCVKACTGSGKTLAYTVPLVQSLQKLDVKDYAKQDVVCLILAPSRELAVQIAQIVQEFESMLNGFSMCYCIGGTKPEYDMQRISEKGGHIIVATIGRLFDLIDKQAFNFKRLEMLIMDEADKLLEDGHEVKLNYILNSLPKQRRTGLFSATMTSQLKNLIRIGMRNPFFVEVKLQDQGIFAMKNDKNSVSIKEFVQTNDKDQFNKQIQEISEIPSNLQNYYQILDNQAQKLPALIEFLNVNKTQRLIVFFGTCASVDFHMIILPLLSLNSKFYKLHGKIDQKKRTKIYSEFRAQNKDDDSHLVLLTTDLSSRGIDIPDVDWIIQFDPPQESDSFVHRIGRTARAGRSGKSLIFLTKNEESYIPFLERKQVNMEKLEDCKNIEGIFTDIQERLWKDMKSDRDLVDKAQNAFVSYMRYYKEHHLNFIFAINILDIGQVANAFFLFKIPRVKEILGKPTKSFIGDSSVILELVPYKDKNKQKQKEGVKEKRKEKFDRKEQDKIERQDKEIRQKKIKSVSQKKRKKQENDWNEWDELAREENLAKKLRKGKITKEEFNRLLGDDDSDFEEEEEKL